MDFRFFSTSRRKDILLVAKENAFAVLSREILDEIFILSSFYSGCVGRMRSGVGEGM